MSKIHFWFESSQSRLIQILLLMNLIYYTFNTKKPSYFTSSMYPLYLPKILSALLQNNRFVISLFKFAERNIFQWSNIFLLIHCIMKINVSTLLVLSGWSGLVLKKLFVIQVLNFLIFCCIVTIILEYIISESLIPCTTPHNLI